MSWGVACPSPRELEHAAVDSAAVIKLQPLSLPPKLWSLKRFLRDLGITGPSRGAFTLLGPDSMYQISL